MQQTEGVKFHIGNLQNEKQKTNQFDQAWIWVRETQKITKEKERN